MQVTTRRRAPRLGLSCFGQFAIVPAGGRHALRRATSLRGFEKGCSFKLSLIMGLSVCAGTCDMWAIDAMMEGVVQHASR